MIETIFYSVSPLDPPSVVLTPPSGIISGFTGDSFTFNCSVTGSSVQLTWYRNTTMITPGSVLTIASATPADSAVYQCLWYSEFLRVTELATWGLVINDPGGCGSHWFQYWHTLIRVVSVLVRLLSASACYNSPVCVHTCVHVSPLPV